MSFTQRANTLELCKHTGPNLQTWRRLLTSSTHEMLLVLPHMQHSTHYLMSNLPPGREWKRCQSLFTVAHTSAEVADREVTRSLCSVTQCRVCVCTLLFIYHAAAVGFWNRSARQHFAVPWNPERSCVAFLYRLLACSVRSSRAALPAACRGAQYKSHQLHKKKKKSFWLWNIFEAFNVI